MSQVDSARRELGDVHRRLREVEEERGSAQRGLAQASAKAASDTSSAGLKVHLGQAHGILASAQWSPMLLQLSFIMRCCTRCSC